MLRERLVTCDLGLVEDVARALRALGDEEAAAVAIGALEDERPRVRLAAVAALAGLGSREPHHLEALRRASADRIAGVRRRALDALARAGRGPADLEACLARRDDPDAQVRAAAAGAVAALDSAGGPLLAPLAEDPSAAVRRRVARLAARLPAPAAARLLYDDDRHVRELAAENAGVPAVASLLAVLREDTIPDVRRRAARRLGELGAAAATGGLVDALADPDSVTRVAALRALETLHRRPALLGLLAMELGDRRRRDRTSLLYALVRLRARELQSRLRPLVLDPEPDLRLALAHNASVLFTDPAEVLRDLAHDLDPLVAHVAESALRGGGARGGPPASRGP